MVKRMRKVFDAIKIAIPILICLFAVGIFGELDLQRKTFESYKSDPDYYLSAEGQIVADGVRDNNFMPYQYTLRYMNVDGTMWECDYSSWGKLISGNRVNFYYSIDMETLERTFYFGVPEFEAKAALAIAWGLLIISIVTELRLFGLLGRVNTMDKNKRQFETPIVSADSKDTVETTSKSTEVATSDIKDETNTSIFGTDD